MQRLQRQQVGGDVFAHGGVGAAAGFDGEDAGRGQGEVAGQELGVFAGVGEEGLGCCFGGGGGGLGDRKGEEYRVKMSLVTAAMLYSSRSLRQSWSMRAVLPEPTGLLDD